MQLTKCTTNVPTENTITIVRTVVTQLTQCVTSVLQDICGATY